MNCFHQTFAVRVIVACCAALPLTARAQNSLTTDTLYNNGVAAYFRGASAEAESSFSRLLAVDRNDPRAYYFRAFSLVAQGRADEARACMRAGAQVEARLPNRFDIGKTLERVQGPTRLQLEQYRREARHEAAMNPPRGPVRSPDVQVLYERRIVPLDEFFRAGQPQSFVAPVPALQTTKPPAPSTTQPSQNIDSGLTPLTNPFPDDPAIAPPPKAPSKVPSAKASAADAPSAKAAPDSPPAKAPLPPAPKPAAPKPNPVEAEDNPF